MIHYDRDCFCIRMHQRSKVVCPICGDSFTTSGVDVCDPNNEPICDLCAWEHVTSLAGLVSLFDAAAAFYHGDYPPHIWDRIEKRRNDPKRLKKELQKDYDSISSNGPLGEFLKDELQVALDGKDVKKLKAAKLLFEETKRGITTSSYADLDAEIPF